MNLPDANTSPTKWIMWAATALLITVLGLVSPVQLAWKQEARDADASTLMKSYVERFDTIIKSQNLMQREHMDLLKVSIIQCYNHADNVIERTKREQQQRRCLTLQLNEAP